MSADGKLFDIEDSLKQKHLDLVKQRYSQMISKH